MVVVRAYVVAVVVVVLWGGLCGFLIPSLDYQTLHNSEENIACDKTLQRLLLEIKFTPFSLGMDKHVY